MASLSLSRLFGNAKLRPSAAAATKAHQVAQEHWRQCTNTFITNAEYYTKCENAIRHEVIPRLGHLGRLLDAGCGNGRFTLLFAQTSDDIDAHDLSPALIADAQRAASDAGLTCVRFYVDDVIHARTPDEAYDVVSCMGVLSTIVDDWAFQTVTRKLSGALKTKGLLLLRESVSLLPEGQIIESETYATRYRNEKEYCAHFSELGFTLEHTIPLAEFGTSVNRFYLYRKY
jgi:2-polyprenyl-3-methyl-5-hydroxy-6-metoxy-1,4-benzoquinol methylase